MSLKRIAILTLSVAFLFSISSCIIYTKHEPRTKKGWYKNRNNPHHPRTTNPGKGHQKGQHKGNSKGNSKGNRKK